MVAHLCQALQRDVAKGGLGKELQQDFDDIGLEDVAERDPGQVGVERGQGGANQVWLLAGVQHKQAELMNKPKFRIQGLLQVLDFCLQAFPWGSEKLHALLKGDLPCLNSASMRLRDWLNDCCGSLCPALVFEPFFIIALARMDNADARTNFL